MNGVIEYFFSRALLNNLTGVHDSYLIGKVLDHPEVVRNEQVCHAGFTL
jgi:hypothetical protein